MATIIIILVFPNRTGNSAVLASRTLALLMAAIAGCMVMQPWRAQAQWWGSRGPVDFEECADIGEKAATKEARTAALLECNAKFAGRRKLGGGYTYFDFMQNRKFDIAGPNPTPEEQKHIDEQYTAYLDNQRRSNIAAAFAAKQQQLLRASLKTEGDRAPLVTGSTGRPQAAASDTKRAKAAGCAGNTLSCEWWPKLSEGIKDLKKALFGPSSSKAKRS
jgi:hypothetical protein